MTKFSNKGPPASLFSQLSLTWKLIKVNEDTMIEITVN